MEGQTHRLNRQTQLALGSAPVEGYVNHGKVMLRHLNTTDPWQLWLLVTYTILCSALASFDSGDVSIDTIKRA